MEEQTLNELVARLAQYRAIEAEYKQEITDLRAELADTPAGKRLEAVHKFLEVAKEDVATAETRLRGATLEAWRDNGHKNPHDATQVKMWTVVTYDADDALDYCRQHLPKALRLNRTEFEKAAKVVQPDFVTISKEPRVSIARDLSAWRGEQ